MKDICFVIPYFGKFNNYFQLFLNSCRPNNNCDWLIFTDDKRIFDYPENVIVHYMEFCDLQEKIRSVFSFEISLVKPYKLCDYKSFYGLIFKDYLKNYRFWGHCDTDMIFGDIASFITQEDLNTYDKIGIVGHCTIYRNVLDINELCMKPLNGVDRAKAVLTEYWNHSFDEEFNDSINNIFEEYEKKIDYREHEANIYRKSSDLRITRMKFPSHQYTVERRTNSFYVWENGRLYRYLIKNGTLRKEEYMYIHLQARPMRVTIHNYLKYKIIANSFDDLEVEKVDLDTFRQIKKMHFNLHYFKHRSRNLVEKIKKRFDKEKTWTYR